MTSTGRSSEAARAARSTASWKVADWPMNCVSRSIPNHWQYFPTIGKENRFGTGLCGKLACFSAPRRSWHAPCKEKHEPAHCVPAQRKQGRLIHEDDI